MHLSRQLELWSVSWGSMVPMRTLKRSQGETCFRRVKCGQLHANTYWRRVASVRSVDLCVYIRYICIFQLWPENCFFFLPQGGGMSLWWASVPGSNDGREVSTNIDYQLVGGTPTLARGHAETWDRYELKHLFFYFTTNHNIIIFAFSMNRQLLHSQLPLIFGLYTVLLWKHWYYFLKEQTQ